MYSDDDVLIQVEDNGIGISGDIIEDIFVPFYTTKGKWFRDRTKPVKANNAKSWMVQFQ